VNVIIAFEIAHNGAGAVIESRVPALLAHLPAHAGTAALRASKRERERARAKNAIRSVTPRVIDQCVRFGSRLARLARDEAAGLPGDSEKTRRHPDTRVNSRGL